MYSELSLEQLSKQLKIFHVYNQSKIENAVETLSNVIFLALKIAIDGLINCNYKF